MDKKVELIKDIATAKAMFDSTNKDDTKQIHLIMSELQIAWLIETIISFNTNMIKATKKKNFNKNLLNAVQLEVGMGDSLLAGFKYALEKNAETSKETTKKD